MPLTSENNKHWGNRYIYLDNIGKGSYGLVYKVKDTKGSEGQDSIKVLKEIPIDSMDKDEIDECTREGKLLSKLKHPNIIQFFDSFSFKNTYCIITEFCEGGDLKKVIETTKRNGEHLDELRIIRWFIQIIQGIDFIHKRKILHRDLKPNNIFLKSDSVKIGDFGISRILNFTMDLASTFLGTPYYMSPEVLKHDGYNTTSDIWSIGIVLYEMCALKHAFIGKNIMEVMMNIMEKPCPKIPSIYCKDLQNIINHILIKDPTIRPSAREILELPFMKLKIQDPWIDVADSFDLSETMVKKDRDEISNYMSKSVDLKVLPDDTIKLTPKQKLQMKKDREAQQRAEEQKQHIQKTYNNNKEIRKELKNKNFQESLPFANRRSETSRSSISEYDELNSSSNSVFSGSKTVIPSKYNHPEKFDRFSKTEKIQKHFDKKSMSNDQFFEKDNEYIIQNNNNNNQNGLFRTKYSDFIFEDSSNCDITTYDPVNDPMNKESHYQYENDFESDSSSNVDSSHDQSEAIEILNYTVDEKFQDNIESDPFGKNIKQKKINTMKKKCLEKIDEATLEKALIYLKETSERKNYLNGLIKICKANNDVAMTVDQIYFLTNPMNSIF